MKASSRDPPARHGPSSPAVSATCRTLCLPPAQFVTGGGVVRKRKDAMMCDGRALLPHAALCVCVLDPWLSLGEAGSHEEGDSSSFTSTELFADGGGAGGGGGRRRGRQDYWLDYGFVGAARVKINQKPLVHHCKSCRLHRHPVK